MSSSRKLVPASELPADPPAPDAPALAASRPASEVPAPPAPPPDPVPPDPVPPAPAEPLVLAWPDEDVVADDVADVPAAPADVVAEPLAEFVVPDVVLDSPDDEVSSHVVAQSTF
jgi:hypothetical protein